MIITDEYISELFSNISLGHRIVDTCSGTRTYDNVNEQKQQIYQALFDLTSGEWVGYTVYDIVLHGGFIHDGKKHKVKKLTALGIEFMSQQLPTKSHDLR